MTHIRFVSTIAALCLALGVSAGAAAAAEEEEKSVDRTGIYGGIGFGLGLHEEMKLDDGTLTGEELEDAWRLIAWFRPWNVLAFEMGYIDSGDPQGPQDVDGVHLAIVPTLPLPYNFDLFVKAGGFFLEDNDIAVGAGLAYYLPNNFGLRLDWDHLGVEDNSRQSNGDDIDVVTLAVFYRLSGTP